jgi:hypothetical protein
VNCVQVASETDAGRSGSDGMGLAEVTAVRKAKAATLARERYPEYMMKEAKGQKYGFI